MFNQIKINSMLLVRVKETGTIAEVKPSFCCGCYTGFCVVNSNTVYSYKDVDILNDAEISEMDELQKLWMNATPKQIKMVSSMIRSALENMEE